jgi:hypothetical protein
MADRNDDPSTSPGVNTSYSCRSTNTSAPGLRSRKVTSSVSRPTAAAFRAISPAGSSRLT